MKRIKQLLTILFVMLIFSGCAASVQDVDLGQVMEEMEKQVTLSEMIELDESDLTDMYGIQPEDVKQFQGKILSDGLNPDELALVEAKDADAASRIQKALEQRLTNKGNEAKNYNPEGYALIQKCSVQVTGNYVCMLVSPEYEKLNSIYGSFIK